jgi:hypothetical protein
MRRWICWYEELLGDVVQLGVLEEEQLGELLEEEQPGERLEEQLDAEDVKK